MALGYSLLATHRATSNTDTYTDAETTQPAAGSALLCFIFIRGTTTVPTISAYGATWTELSGARESGGSGGSAWIFTCYEAYAGGSPSSSTATVTVTGGGTGGGFDIVEITGADTSDFTVQAVGEQGTATSGSITLASFGDATNNGAVASFGIQANEAMTPDSTATWSEISDAGWNTPNSRMATETRTGEDTTVTYGWTTSVIWAGIAVEVKVASSNVLDEYAFASETDAAMPFLAASNQTVEFGFASETDAAQPFSADTQIVDDFGFASETDAAMPFSADTQIVDDYGFAEETDTAMPFSADTQPLDLFDFASETDEAMPFTATASTDIAFDAATDLGTATTGALTGTHTPVGDPDGVVVKIVHGTETTDLITGVTYGGVPLDRVGFAIDDAGEPGRAYLYFLGSGIPTGPQTVTVSHTGTATVKWANVESYTAGEDTTVAATWQNNNMGLVDDLYSATIYTQQTSLRTGVMYGGHANVGDLTLLSGMTAVNSVDFTNFIGRADRETTASAGSFPYGYTAGTTDDFAAFTAALVGVSSVPTTPLSLVSTHVFTWTTLTNPSFGIYTGDDTSGAIMFVGMYGTPSATDFFTSATYGAASFTEYAHATDTAGEAGHSWGLYVSDISGSDTVSMTATSVTNPQVAVVFCIASGVNLIDSGTDSENQANPSDALDSGAEDAIRFGFIFSGLATSASLAPSNLPDEILTLDGLNATSTRLDADLTPTAGNITVGWTAVSDDVAAVYGAFSEGDVLDSFGLAEETDTAMPFEAATQQTVTYGFADETDTAMPFEAATQQTAEFAFASETDEAMPFEAVVGDTPVEDLYGFASETDTAMPFTAFAESPSEGDDSPDEGSPTSPEDSPIDSPIIDSPDEDSPDESPFSPPVDPGDTFCPPYFMARRGRCC